MELKTPTKKGIKTPRDRPPLPMLNESYSGFCVDEYDWPLFNGYYNGTSVIVDDSQAMTLLTNKGFFGKGSLSKGCPNLAKRKIPVSVVYESQWKRRKMWIQNLNMLLESRKKSKETSESKVIDINKKESNEAEKMEVDKEENSSLRDNSCKTEQNSSKTSKNEDNEKCHKQSDESSKYSVVDIENKKSNEVDEKEIENEKNTSPQNNSCKTDEEPSETNENKGNETSLKSIETSQKNISDTDNKGSDVEKMEVESEKKNPQNESCNIKEEPSKTSENEENTDSRVLFDTDINTKQNIEETEGQKELDGGNKNEEIRNSSVENIQNESKLKDSVLMEDNNGDIKKSTSSNVVEDQTKSVQHLSIDTEKGTLNINEVLVIPDIDGELEQYFLNLKPYIEEEKVKTAIEVLYLSLEEAFFLSYCCNCLQIFDLTSNILPIKDMWVLFQESQPDFIEKYVAYHYFRAKGWVVKSGTKFGGDFLLYKKGPLYFHSSYIVMVEVLKNEKNSRNKTTWQKIVGMNRMAESANKEILICHVLWPDVEEEKFNDPAILREFRVSETLLRRWQATATQEKTP